MRTLGWPYPFRARPWDEISASFAVMTRRAPWFGHMLAIADSVMASGSADMLAGCTSMHDLIVVTVPIPEPPYDVIAVRAPGSLDGPAAGYVRVRHLTRTGRDDRPVAEAVPLFWRFVVEKYGIHPAQQLSRTGSTYQPPRARPGSGAGAVPACFQPG
jgi:hypothetical protein